MLDCRMQCCWRNITRIGVDLVQDRVDAVNSRVSPIIDFELSQYLTEKDGVRQRAPTLQHQFTVPIM